MNGKEDENEIIGVPCDSATVSWHFHSDRYARQAFVNDLQLFFEPTSDGVVASLYSYNTILVISHQRNPLWHENRKARFTSGGIATRCESKFYQFFRRQNLFSHIVILRQPDAFCRIRGQKVFFYAIIQTHFEFLEVIGQVYCHAIFLVKSERTVYKAMCNMVHRQRSRMKLTEV